MVAADEARHLIELRTVSAGLVKVFGIVTEHPRAGVTYDGLGINGARAGRLLLWDNGRNVILQAVRKLTDAALEITQRNGVSIEEVDLLIPHQANGNLIRALAARLSFTPERIVTNVDRFGNTSGASTFIALWQAHRERRLRPGKLTLILAFGAGFTWGAALCRVVSADRQG